jgi:hypothetical protein
MQLTLFLPCFLELQHIRVRRRSKSAQDGYLFKLSLPAKLSAKEIELRMPYLPVFLPNKWLASLHGPYGTVSLLPDLPDSAEFPHADRSKQNKVTFKAGVGTTYAGR